VAAGRQFQQGRRRRQQPSLHAFERVGEPFRGARGRRRRDAILGLLAIRPYSAYELPRRCGAASSSSGRAPGPPPGPEVSLRGDEFIAEHRRRYG
jgi:hypothetical protein